MPDTFIEPPGATVRIVENPHTDAVTVAYSAYDAAVDRASISDDEIARTASKLERAKVDVVAAEAIVTEAAAAKVRRAQDVADALAELDEVKAANPELAAEVDARRIKARADEIAALHARLDSLTKEG